VPGIGGRKDVYIFKGLDERKVKILFVETGRSVKSFYHPRSAAIHYFERKFKKPILIRRPALDTGRWES
jgi:hypothetical protein